jgi:hypothetical protein
MMFAPAASGVSVTPPIVTTNDEPEFTLSGCVYVFFDTTGNVSEEVPPSGFVEQM